MWQAFAAPGFKRLFAGLSASMFGDFSATGRRAERPQK
jgi:hypothetical protein